MPPFTQFLTLGSGLIVFFVLIIGVGIIASLNHAQSVANLYPHESKPFNYTMAEWLEKYWNWTASIPAEMHPKNDISGETCGINQSGPVWFLDFPISSGMVTKTLECEIPEGKAIFVPLLVGECDTAESGSDSELSQCAKQGNDGGNIIFSIDGKRLLSIDRTSQSQHDYSRYRTTTDFFNIYWPTGNLYDLPNGTFRGIADGYFAIIQPPPIGDHKINFLTSVFSPYQFDYNLSMNITFNIKIVKSQNFTG